MKKYIIDISKNDPNKDKIISYFKSLEIVKVSEYGKCMLLTIECNSDTEFFNLSMECKRQILTP